MDKPINPALISIAREAVKSPPQPGEISSKSIDHTLLKPEATTDQVIQLCQEAVKYGFATVCINPIYVPLAAEQLAGTNVKVCVVVGFPLGATPTAVKVFETEEAIRQGAQDIDMVIAIGELKAGNADAVRQDIGAVVEAAHAKGAQVKVIIEACLLSQEEKILAAKIVKEAGADFVKTSTGFSIGGATEADVRLLREIAGTTMGVKAAGGIRSLEDAEKMMRAGADRIGTSSGVKIIEAALKRRVHAAALQVPGNEVDDNLAHTLLHKILE